MDAPQLLGTLIIVLVDLVIAVAIVGFCSYLIGEMDNFAKGIYASMIPLIGLSLYLTAYGASPPAFFPWISDRHYVLASILALALAVGLYLAVKIIKDHDEDVATSFLILSLSLVFSVELLMLLTGGIFDYKAFMGVGVITYGMAFIVDPD